MKLKFLILFVLANSLFTQCFPQIYNINKNNGLPDNRIYSLHVDKNSYLWMPTPKGLVLYNGYNTVKYDMSDGLPTDDIWEVEEDVNGRIWLVNISNELGYIENGKYHPKLLTPPDEVIYPKCVTGYNNGFAFLSPIPSNGSFINRCLYIIAKNTAFKIYLGRHETGNHAIVNNQLMNILDTHFYLLNISHRGISVQRKNYAIDSFIKTHSLGNNLWSYKQYIYMYRNEQPYLWMVNTRNGSTMRLEVAGRGEHMVYPYTERDYLYIAGTQNIYKYDSLLRKITQYPLSQLSNNEIIQSSKPLGLYENSFWGNCLWTYDKGVFIDPVAHKKFSRQHIDLADFKYIGYTSDSQYYFWNEEKQLLAELSGRNTITYTHLPVLKKVNKINVFNNTDAMLRTNDGLYKLNYKNKTITTYYKSDNLQAARDIVLIDTNNIYGIYRSLRGFCRNSRHIETDNTAIDYYTYTNICYDSLRNGIWASGKQRILFYSLKTKTKVVINKTLLEYLNIRNVDQLLADNTHDIIFIKSNDRILIVRLERLEIKYLITGYRYKESTVSIHRNKLVIAGRFGILFSKISSRGRFSIPIVYPNIKNTYFEQVHSMQVLNSQVLLQTDKGTYGVSLPPDSSLSVNKISNDVKHKVIAMNNRSTITIKENDTLWLNQNEPAIKLDVINPAGNGQLQIKYRLNRANGKWKKLNSGELNFSGFKPVYYTVSIIVGDDVWESRQLYFTVYIKPYWWQTKKWYVLFTITSVIVLVVLGYIVYEIARKNTTKKTEKKNMLLELELRSIYAQINPHFIFNTLNTSLFLVKTNKNEEAYAHIGKFSRLLRSYLESTKDRLVLLQDEIQHIKDYIELQQSRFAKKFDYLVEIDPRLNIAEISIPTLLLQPIVENAIVHGLLNKAGHGTLSIKFEEGQTKKEIVCVIEDNGIGREHAQKINAEKSIKKRSFGSMLIEDLIKLTNQYQGVKLGITYTDKKIPETGTIVKITIKIP